MHHLILEQFSQIKTESKSGDKIFEETIYLHRRHPAKNIVTFLTHSKIESDDKMFLKSRFEELKLEKKIRTCIIGHKSVQDFIIRPMTWDSFTADKRIGHDRNKEFKDLLAVLKFTEFDRKIVSLFAIYMHEHRMEKVSEGAVTELVKISRLKLESDEITRCLDNFPLIVIENDQYKFLDDFFLAYYVYAEIEEYEHSSFKGAIKSDIRLIPNVEKFPTTFADLKEALIEMEKEKSLSIKQNKWEQAAIIHGKIRHWVNTVFIGRWNEMNAKNWKGLLP